MSSARRFMGLGATVAALGIVLTGCFPPKAPPPPPKFKLAAGLWRTAGTAPGASECQFARTAADGSVITDVHSDHGARYVETADTDSEFVTSGCQPWTKYDGTEQPGGPVPIPWSGQIGQIFFPRRGFADGDYIVGHENFGLAPEDVTGDVNYGTVTVNVTTAACQWQRLSDWTGDPGTVLQSGDGIAGDGSYPPPQLGALHLHEGEGIRLVDCNGMFWWGNS
jgi:hypothetical protein